MKIVALEAENVMRLKAVRIEPDGTLQIVGGKNAQGKSSLLNAIFLALGGGQASRDIGRPVRDGESDARVALNLGEVTVVREWNQKGTKLTVTPSSGAPIKAPQALLDTLVGKMAFDPLAFTRMHPREQRNTLLGLLDLDVDLDALDAARIQAYDERTEIGRQDKTLGEIVKVKEGAPTEVASPTDLITQIRDTETQNAEIENATKAHQASIARVTTLKETIAQLTEDLETEESNVKLSTAKVKKLGQPRPTTHLETKLGDLEEHNKVARDNQEALAKAAQHHELTASYNAKTVEIDKIDAEKAAALANAALPVDGLGIDSDGLTYSGVPLPQASSAEQIRVSVAMGMALNPKLRVLIIRDGSLLDDDSMTAIRDQVAEKDFQLWIERVGNGDEGALIISDGEIAS